MSLKLGEMLTTNKVITDAQLKTALDTQKQIGGKLGAILVKLRYVSEDQLAQLIAEQLKIPVFKLPDLLVQPQVSALVDVELLEKHQILPLRRTKDSLTVAAVDPLDLDGLDDLHFLTGLRIEPGAVSRSNLIKAIDYYFHARPCAEIQAAERSKGNGTVDAEAETRATPQHVLQALTELLIEKKVITQEELLGRLQKRS